MVCPQAAACHLPYPVPRWCLNWATLFPSLPWYYLGCIDTLSVSGHGGLRLIHPLVMSWQAGDIGMAGKLMGAASVCLQHPHLSSDMAVRQYGARLHVRPKVILAESSAGGLRGVVVCSLLQGRSPGWIHLIHSPTFNT